MEQQDPLSKPAMAQYFKDFSLFEQTSNQQSSAQDVEQCPNCHQSDLVLEDGVLMCHVCQLEFGNIIDDTAEWRCYNVDDHHVSDPIRCGATINPLLIESSYSTSIGYTRNPYYSHLKQLNDWQSMPYHERSLKIVFDDLTQCGTLHGLTTNIIDFSHRLFAEATERQNTQSETKLSRGDIRDGLISACLFFACKEYDVSRSPQEISKICGVDITHVTKGINLFCVLMKDSKLINVNRYITKYSDFVERYCNSLGIEGDLVTEIIELGNKVDQLKIPIKNTPQALACGCILFVINMYKLNITKTIIAEKCGISVPTITKSYERLLPYSQ